MNDKIGRIAMARIELTLDIVRERLRVYRRAGANTLQVNLDGKTLDERLATLGQVVELVREVNAEP